MKCDEKPKKDRERFKPESPLIIVCEGYRDAKFLETLLTSIKVTNCDVTFPQQDRVEKADGESGIVNVVKYLVETDTVQGIAVVRDADLNAKDAFDKACAGYSTPYATPTKPFSIERGKKTSGIFIVPGKGKTGGLEHLLFDAVAVSHPNLVECIGKFEECNAHVAGWAENMKSKLRMQCAVAGFCEEDPTSSLAYIWHRTPNPIDIDCPSFKELKDFLADFSAS